MKWYRKLDDLDEGKTVVEIDCGQILVRGLYRGMCRVQVEGSVRWYLEIDEENVTRKKGDPPSLVNTRDIENIKVLHRG